MAKLIFSATVALFALISFSLIITAPATRRFISKSNKEIHTEKLKASKNRNCPEIISREEWGARPPTGVEKMETPVPFVVIHHTVMGEGECNTPEECVQVMRDIQNLHMDISGWADIGYSFLIGGDGRVYKGRGWDRVGAHAPGYNDKSLGVALVGNFTDHLPTKQQLNATRSFIACALDSGNVIQNYTLLGHRDTRDTKCPGDVLYEEISSWPQFHFNFDNNPLK